MLAKVKPVSITTFIYSHAVQLLQEQKHIKKTIQNAFNFAPVLTLSQAQSPTEEVKENSSIIS